MGKRKLIHKLGLILKRLGLKVDVTKFSDEKEKGLNVIR